MSYPYNQMQEASAVGLQQQQQQLMQQYSGAATANSPTAMNGSSNNSDVDSYPMSEVVYPGHNDVMCGRGGGTNNHIGNVRFRQLVQGHKLRYLAAPKIDKPRVAREVVMIWRGLDPPGRFLTKTKAECGDSSPWHDVGDKKAREKASQCLRERTPDVLPFVKQLQLREAREKEKEEGAVRPDNVKSETNAAVVETSEEETKRFEAALARSNDPIAQASLTQYLNDTAPANSKIRSRRGSMESSGSYSSGAPVVSPAFAAAASYAANAQSADWATGTEEERLRQQQILEQARQAQEAALLQQARSQNGVVQQLGIDQTTQQQQFQQQQQQQAAAVAMQAQAQALAAQEQQRQIMEQAKAVQRQALELDRQRAEMEKQRMHEQAAAAAIAAQLEQEKRKLQEQAAALRSAPANVTDDDEEGDGGRRKARKRSSREELANSIPSAAELMDGFGDVDGPAGPGSGEEELTMEEYQKSIELFLSSAPGGMPPPAPKPPRPDAMPSRGDMMETMSQTSWVKSFASIDSASTMLFSISGQSLKNIVEGEELGNSKSNLNYEPNKIEEISGRRESNATLPAGNTKRQENNGGAAPVAALGAPEAVVSRSRPQLSQQELSRSERLKAANSKQNVSSVSMMSDLTDFTATTLTDKSKKGAMSAAGSRSAMMKSAGGMNSNISMMSELTDLSDHLSALEMKE